MIKWAEDAVAAMKGENKSFFYFFNIIIKCYHINHIYLGILDL